MAEIALGHLAAGRIAGAQKQHFWISHDRPHFLNRSTLNIVNTEAATAANKDTRFNPDQISSAIAKLATNI
jgi:hypothetical protein